LLVRTAGTCNRIAGSIVSVIRLNQVVGKCRPVTSPRTEVSSIKARHYGPNTELIAVVRLLIWFRNRLFLQRGESTRSTAHRHRTVSFPEGELLDSQGCAAPRLPWVGDIQEVPEPCRVSLTCGSLESVSSIDLCTPQKRSHSARGSSRWHALSHPLQGCIELSPLNPG
jgi:hypothetical protein